MNCDGVRDLLSAYLDGELSAGELLRVEQHLRRCHACAGEVIALRQAIELVASMPEVEVPESFHTRLHERLMALEPPVVSGRLAKAQGWKRHMRTWVLPATAAVAALTVGLTGLLQRSGQLLPGLEVQREVPLQSPAAVVANQRPADATPPAPTSGNGSGVQPVTPAVPSSALAVNPRSAPTITNDTPVAAPIDNRIPITLSGYAASYLERVAPVDVLPSKSSVSYSMTARVKDPTAITKLLAERYAIPSEGSPTVGGADIFSVITVPLQNAQSEMIYIKSVLGENVTEEAPIFSDRSASIQMLYNLLKELDSLRANRVRAMIGVTDPALLDVAKKELEDLSRQATEAQANLDRLLKQVQEVTITVIIQRQAQ